MAARDPNERKIAREFFWAKMRLLRLYQFRDRVSLFYRDVSVTQSYVLAALVRSGDLTSHQLCAILSFEKSTATRVVDGLVKLGYVKRYRHSNDARCVLLHITEAGKKLHDELAENFIDYDEQLLRQFSLRTRREMIKMLHALAEGAVRQMEEQASFTGSEPLSGVKQTKPRLAPEDV
jgi:DNA-binding MarR family transcriptional regulator